MTAPAFDPSAVVDELTGIVRWVSELPIDPGQPEVFNYSAKMCDSGRYLPVGCYDSNGGAGLTREDAYWAAVGESVERYCSSVYFPDELVFGPRRDVASTGTRALGPDELTLFHPEQRQSIRYAWFTEDAPLCWAEGFSLTARESVLVPACLVYIPYYPFFAERGEVTIGPSVSTGHAAGRSSQQVLVRGICEVVERDAFMITWRNRLPLPRIDLSSDERLRRLHEERFARPGLLFTLFDMTTDVAIPSVLCMVVDECTDPPMICFGGATRPDPREAASKALIEAAQTREWARFMARQQSPVVIEPSYGNIDDFDKHVFLYAYADMAAAVEFLSASDRTIKLTDIPRPATGNEATHAMQVAAEVERHGHEIVVIDLTTPDVEAAGFYAGKVIVPGMQAMEGEHSHLFLGGRRLYEVPARLGYSGARSYASLNVDPHPYP